LRRTNVEATRKLWAISDELEEIGALLAEAGGELTPDLEARLDAVEGEFLAKVERVALYIRECERMAEGAKVEKDRLARIQKANESTADGLKRYLLAHLERHGRDKVDTYRARVRRSPSPPSYRWAGDTYEAIPEPFRRTRVTHSLNVDAVKEAIMEGAPLPPEIMVVPGHHIRIS
jgi:hypothetical protein